MWLAANRIRSLGRDDSANNDRDVFPALLIPTYIQGEHGNFKKKKPQHPGSSFAPMYSRRVVMSGRPWRRLKASSLAAGEAGQPWCSCKDTHDTQTCTMHPGQKCMRAQGSWELCDVPASRAQPCSDLLQK